MAHLVIIVCDRCMEAGEQTEATEEFMIAFDSKKPRQLALCAEHYKPFGELRDFAESVGVTVRGGEPPVSRQPSKPCPHCGRIFEDGRALASHVRLGHEDNQLVRCPECGRDYKGTQGLANHRSVAHGIKREDVS